MGIAKKRNPIQIICDEAKLENTEFKRHGRLNGQYLGKTREAKIIKNFAFQPFFVKHIISVKNEPVSLRTFTNYDDSVRTTAGFYTLTYVATTDKRYVKGKPYVIGQDLLRMRVTVSGYQHFSCIAKSIPELAWIKQWCPQLQPKLFGLAKRHPGMNFYFSPDWIGYADMIYEKAEREGIDLNNKVFVTYECSREVRNEIEATHKMSAKKTKQDYKSVLDKANLKFGKEEEE